MCVASNFANAVWVGQYGARSERGVCMAAVRCTDGVRIQGSGTQVPQDEIVRENYPGLIRCGVFIGTQTTAVLRIHEFFTHTLTLPRTNVVLKCLRLRVRSGLFRCNVFWTPAFTRAQKIHEIVISCDCDRRQQKTCLNAEMLIICFRNEDID